MSKHFHIADIIMLYTGICLPIPNSDESPIAHFMDMAIFIANQKLYSIQVATNSEKFKAHLISLHPWLKEIKIPKDISNGSKSDAEIKILIEHFLKEQIEHYGEFHVITQKPSIITTDLLSDLLVSRGIHDHPQVEGTAEENHDSSDTQSSDEEDPTISVEDAADNTNISHVIGDGALSNAGAGVS